MGESSLNSYLGTRTFSPNPELGINFGFTVPGFELGTKCVDIHAL